MKSLLQRGLVVAAVGALAFTATACSAVTEAVEEADDCTDLELQVDKHAPDKNQTLPDTPKEDFAKLTAWMSENGKDFHNKELGQAITDYGDYATGFYQEEQGGEDLSGDERTAFKEASRKIDEVCPDLGFGFANDDE